MVHTLSGAASVAGAWFIRTDANDVSTEAKAGFVPLCGIPAWG